MFLLLKVIVIGDGAVGKTSLTTHFAYGRFIEYYKMTIGVDFFVKDVRIKDDDIVRLQIWDTAGQERFAFMRPSYYEGASGGFLVYDVMRPDTFNHLDRWLREVYEKCGRIPLFVLGNKIDLEPRKVKKLHAEQYAEKQGLPYYETSAKTGECVIDVFTELAHILYNRYLEPKKEYYG